MVGSKLTKFTEISPDEFFKNEEEFSDWLNEHLEEIGEVLGLTLEDGKREVPTGRYSTDIVAKDADSDSGEDIVIIENQLKQTNHDHLGKLITYASGHDAKAIIWISPEFTDEHISAVQWLNAHSSNEVSFFCINLQLIQIQNSPVSPVFSVLVQPLYWENRIKESEQSSPTRKARLMLQQSVIDELGKISGTKVRHRATGRITQQLGFVGKNFDLMCQHHKTLERVSIALRIRKLGRDANQIKEFFEKLEAKKDDIEEQVGEKLDWIIPELSSNQTRYWIKIHRELDESIDSLSDESLFQMAKWLAEKAKKLNDVFLKFE